MRDRRGGRPETLVELWSGMRPLMRPRDHVATIPPTPAPPSPAGLIDFLLTYAPHLFDIFSIIPELKDEAMPRKTMQDCHYDAAILYGLAQAAEELDYRNRPVVTACPG